MNPWSFEAPRTEVGAVVPFTILAIVTLLAGDSAVVAGDPEGIPAGKVCEWRGTAPLCGDPDCEPGEIALERVAEATQSRESPQNFGASCLGGAKAYCCRLFCPVGLVLEAGTDRNRKCVQDRGIPIKPHIITLPTPPAETELRTKGIFEQPKADVLKKGGVIAKPGEGAPPPPPAEKPVTVELNVDVYDKAGGEDAGAVVIGELAKGTQGVFLASPCQADHWCHIKGNVPAGMGWVWSGPGYVSLKF